MIQNEPGLLNDILDRKPLRRKQLLPLWMKLFMWLFLVFCAIIPIVLILGITGHTTDLAIYGLETQQALSVIGISIMIVFIIKGLVSLGMLLEKDWAIKLGIVDAVVGIAICAFCMAYPIFNTDYKFTLRFELAVLIPYLIKLIKIRSAWEQEPSAF